MPTDRDIRELRGHIDPRLGKILIEMNGDIHALRQMIRSLAGMFDHMASMIQVHSTALVQMKDNEDYVKKLREMGMTVSSDPSVTGEIDEK